VCSSEPALLSSSHEPQLGAYHDIGAGGKRMIKILFLVAQCAAIVGVTGFLFWRSKKSRSR
jgi:hypothetical protein